jgi:hypothetical protein
LKGAMGLWQVGGSGLNDRADGAIARDRGQVCTTRMALHFAL